MLDLGAGEEGVGNREVRYLAERRVWPDPMWVHFLDRNGHSLGQGRLNLIAGINPVPSTATVTNPTHPYR